jgi:hypothetical protein
MPLKRKNKLRNKIIFWALAAIAAFLMVYVPKPPAERQMIEYELY